MLTFVLCLLLLPFLSNAQQYEGDTIKNNLTAVLGSKISYFKIDDGNGGSATLINYFSHPGGKRQDPKKVKRAIVVLHGFGAYPDFYFDTVWSALGRANKLNNEVTEDATAIIVPYFPNDNDKNTGYLRLSCLFSYASMALNYYLIDIPGTTMPRMDTDPPPVLSYGVNLDGHSAETTNILMASRLSLRMPPSIRFFFTLTIKAFTPTSTRLS